jgi:hypothetical protein
MERVLSLSIFPFLANKLNIVNPSYWSARLYKI